MGDYCQPPESRKSTSVIWRIHKRPFPIRPPDPLARFRVSSDAVIQTSPYCKYWCPWYPDDQWFPMEPNRFQWPQGIGQGIFRPRWVPSPFLESPTEIYDCPANWTVRSPLLTQKSMTQLMDRLVTSGDQRSSPAGDFWNPAKYLQLRSKNPPASNPPPLLKSPRSQNLRDLAKTPLLVFEPGRAQICTKITQNGPGFGSKTL